MSAGNFGDVWKHSVLLELIDLIKCDDFKYVETHGNYAFHDVKCTGNSSFGFHYLRNKINLPSMNPLYWQINCFPARKDSSYTYLSSWMQVHKLLTTRQNKFTETVFEIDKKVHGFVSSFLEVSNDLNQNVLGNINYLREDGYKGIKKLTFLPNLVVIDPYYKKEKNEIRKVLEISSYLDKESIPYIIWYPLPRSKDRRNIILSQLVSKFKNKLELHDLNVNNNSTHIPASGIIFSDNLSHHIPNVEKKLSYLDDPTILKWQIK